MRSLLADWRASGASHRRSASSSCWLGCIGGIQLPRFQRTRHFRTLGGPNYSLKSDRCGLAAVLSYDRGRSGRLAQALGLVGADALGRLHSRYCLGRFFSRRARSWQVRIFTRLFRLGRPARCALRFFPARAGVDHAVSCACGRARAQATLVSLALALAAWRRQSLPVSWLAGFAPSKLRGLTVRSSGTAAGWLQYYQSHRGAAAP